MKTLALLLAFGATLFACETIRPASKVHVTLTKDDFDGYLMAEIQEQNLPTFLVTRCEEDDYDIATNEPGVDRSNSAW